MILGIVLADGPNLRRCVVLVVAGAAAVVVIGWLVGPYRNRDGSSYARHLRTSPRAVLLAFLSSVSGEPAGPGARCAVGDESCTSWTCEAPDYVMEGTAGNG